MFVAFRVDASEQIGTGHLMRCLTLADKLHQHGATVLFISRELPGHLCDFVEQKKGYEVLRLPMITPQLTDHYASLDVYQTKYLLTRQKCGVDWFVIDHYWLDRRFEHCFRDMAKQILAIDDLANREHDCDVLFDQNLCENMQRRYDGLVPDHAIRILGPKYSLLQEAFWKLRKTARPRDGKVKRVLLFFGGTDPTNEMEKALRAVPFLRQAGIHFDVVVGSSNSRRREIEALCASLPDTTYYCQIDHFAEVMSRADLSIGAGGTTAWERCCLGLPTVTIVVADNQVEATHMLAQNGVIINLGWHQSVTSEMIVRQINELLQRPEVLRAMSKRALATVDDGLPEIIRIMRQSDTKSSMNNS